MPEDSQEIRFDAQDQKDARWPFDTTPIDSADDLLDHVLAESESTVEALDRLNNSSTGHPLIETERTRLAERYDNLQSLLSRLGALAAPQVVDDLITRMSGQEPNSI